MDAATAAGYLGAAVTAKVTLTSCEFAGGRSKLRIEVDRFTAAHDRFEKDRDHCREASPLTAIGNEAFLCNKNHEITSRVRNAIFKVRLTTTEENWRSKAQAIAEQVAGALF